jgi:hypothetical protein
VGRDDVGEDGLLRWERDDLARFANTRDPGFLLEVEELGSVIARARARRLRETLGRQATATPLPRPDPTFAGAARQVIAEVRRRAATDPR